MTLIMFLTGQFASTNRLRNIKHSNSRLVRAVELLQWRKGIKETMLSTDLAERTRPTNVASGQAVRLQFKSPANRNLSHGNPLGRNVLAGEHAPSTSYSPAVVGNGNTSNLYCLMKLMPVLALGIPLALQTAGFLDESSLPND